MREMVEMSRKVILLIVFSVIGALLIGIVSRTLDIPHWQNLDVSRITDLHLSTRVFDRFGEEAAVLSSGENRVYVPLDQLPNIVSEAFVAAEDARFYKHHGVDLKRIFGALWHDLRTFSFSQGASTITQQLIKLTHLSGDKTLSRKAQEAYLALMLERILSKEEILEAYLNTVYFGGGAYGIEAASRLYFDVGAVELNAAQAAILAGIVKSPSHYSPFEHPTESIRRGTYVLEAMAECGYLTEKEKEKWEKKPIRFSEKASALPNYGWYTDETFREACELLEVSSDELMTGGYAIYTALDPSLQAAAQDTMEKEEYYPEPAVQSACVAMSCSDGEVLAMVGGRSYEVRLGFNRATDSHRQLGSVIKPISTYAAAVDRYGYLPTSMVYDEQRTYADGYAPGNSNGTYAGEVTLRTALSRSLNAATVDLADTLGISRIADYAKRFGLPLTASDENLALALGSMEYGASPMDICTAYCALADGGILYKPHLIREIRDRNGATVYRYADHSERIVSEETAYLLTDILKTAADTGTAKRLNDLGFPVAAKTGTAGLDNGDTGDAWTTAYTPEIAVTVWMGLDSNESGGMASGVTGGGYACPICKEILRAADAYTGSDFPIPDGLRPLLIDGCALENENRLLLASPDTPREYVRREYCRRNDAELPVSDIWNAPASVTDLALFSSSNGKPILQFTANSPYADYLLLRTIDGESRIAAVLNGSPGQQLSFEDNEADSSASITYSVIPRHRQLYEAGTLVTGSEGNRVVWNPPGLLDRFSRLLQGDDAENEIETIEDPLIP